MTWIFKNRKGKEIRMSDEEVEEARLKIPDIATINIPELNDNCYFKDRYEKD